MKTVDVLKTREVPNVGLLIANTTRSLSDSVAAALIKSGIVKLKTKQVKKTTNDRED